MQLGCGADGSFDPCQPSLSAKISRGLVGQGLIRSDVDVALSQAMLYGGPPADALDGIILCTQHALVLTQLGEGNC